LTPNPKPKLVLASASPRRLHLLKQIGLAPDAVAPADVDETWEKNEAPRAHAMRLAREKAGAIRKTHPKDFILAADTIVIKGNRILGKPETPAEAKTFLKILSGGRHRVLTSVVVISPNGKSGQKTATTTVAFKVLSPLEIEGYLKSAEWQGKAGGYAIQGLAGGFVKAINGSYSNVVGLPLYETWCLLEGLGYSRG